MPPYAWTVSGQLTKNKASGPLPAPRPFVARQPLSIGTLWGILVGGVGVRDGYGYGVAVTS